MIGREIPHATYEYSRKQMKSLDEAVAAAVFSGAALAGKDRKAAQALGTGAAVTFSAIQSGYSRDHDDQADRAGLRYGCEAGFNVNQGPKLWRRFAEKYGSRIP